MSSSATRPSAAAVAAICVALFAPLVALKTSPAGKPN